jgi:L-threonylcarbamoyladenylate synthase
MSLYQTAVASIFDSAACKQAVARLAAGEVIAAPTDTVYGVMCRYDDAAAIARLYEAKGRPPHKAIPLLVASGAQMAQLSAGTLPALALTLAERFWPGALTIVVKAAPGLPAILTAGHAALCALLAQTGPLAATSANRSGGADTRTASEVLAQLNGRIPLILADDDVSRSAAGTLPSTIVDVTVSPAVILRAGDLAGAIQSLLDGIAS